MDKVERYINDYTRNCSNELCSIQDKYGKQIISYHEWLTPDNAKEVAEIARKETIDKACEAFCKIECGKPPRSTCISLETCMNYDDFRKEMMEE